MPADLIIYAIVAAGLVFWLRNVLGTRSDDDPQRPVPYLQPEKIRDDGAQPYARPDSVSAEERIIELSEHPSRNLAVDNKGAEAGLIDIARADRSFDITRFLEGAQDAFSIIVEAFAQGDRETLRGLLAEPVCKAFEGVITSRESRGEKAEAEIRAIRKAEVVKARLEGKMAYITVRFTAEEVFAVRGAGGEVIEGQSDRVTIMRDIWTFGRKIGSKDPTWLVYETRDDPEGDSNSIPNSV